MKLKQFVNSNGGFTFVEALISASLLGAAAMFGMQYMQMQAQSRAVAKQRSVEANIAFQVTNRILANYQNYPPLQLSGGQMAAFVGCYGPDGKMMDNSNGEKEFNLIKVQANTEVNNVSTTACVDGKHSFQAIVWWTNINNPNQIEFKIFPVQSSTNLKRIKKYNIYL